MTHEIRAVADDDFFGWLPLFEAYCSFYRTELDDPKALIVWNWIRDDDDPLQAVLAVDDEGAPVGLAHFRVVPDTLQATRGLQLDDLYVDERARGTGVGRELIEFVHARSLEVGTGGVTWITASDNTDAQRLYDQLATRTNWLTYEMGA